MAVSSYALGSVVLTLAWSYFSPRATCYAPEGSCLFFAGEMSNIFFEIDAWFAGIALVLGVVFGLTHNRWWLSHGFGYQVTAALLAIAASYAASKGVETLNPVRIPASGNANFRENFIALGAPSALLIWAFVQQLVFVVSGPKA